MPISLLNWSTDHWHTLLSVRYAYERVSLALFVCIAHATQGFSEIRVYESPMVCIWTRLGCQGMVEWLRNSDRCMRISGFLMKACVTFEP